MGVSSSEELGVDVANASTKQPLLLDQSQDLVVLSDDCLREPAHQPENLVAADEIAQRIHHGQDLGRQSAPRAADGLILSPPFAPLAF